MKTDHNDRGLRKLFSELKRDEATRAPSFARVLGRSDEAGAIHSRFSFPWLRLTAGLSAIAALVLALASLYTGRKSTAADNFEQWAALSNWRASSDSFLTAANSGWASPLSTTTDSWLKDRGNSEGNETKQDKSL